MKLLASVVMVAAIASVGAAQSTPKPTAGDDAAIRAVADMYVKATLAGDAKAIAALYTEDATEMPPNQPAIKGRAAIQQYYEKAVCRCKVRALLPEPPGITRRGRQRLRRRDVQAERHAGRRRGDRRHGQVRRHPETIGRQLESRLRHLQQRSALARRGAVGPRAPLVATAPSRSATTPSRCSSAGRSGAGRR